MASIRVVTIEDVGYFKKSFCFQPNTKLKDVLDAYRAYVCGFCGDASMLEFWYETTKVLEDHTMETLPIQDGDAIDVVVNRRRGGVACPAAPDEIISTPHYLDVAETLDPAQVYEVKAGLPTPERINILCITDGILHASAYEKDSKLIHAMQTFASYARLDFRHCRFLFEGIRVRGSESPKR